MGWIERLLKQTALYWGTPVNDGRGGYTYADPVEVSCRWAERQELFITAQGREETSRAVVHLSSAVVVGGWLMLGTADDISTSDIEPTLVSGAYQIKASASIPSITGDQTLYKAWL